MSVEDALALRRRHLVRDAREAGIWTATQVLRVLTLFHRASILQNYDGVNSHVHPCSEQNTEGREAAVVRAPAAAGSQDPSGTAFATTRHC
jgi:hypothetical protein